MLLINPIVCGYAEVKGEYGIFILFGFFNVGVSSNGLALRSILILNLFWC